MAEPHHPLLTARQAAWLGLRREDMRHEEEAQLCAQLHVQRPEVAEATELTQDFAHLVRQHRGEPLDAWRAWVAKSAIVPYSALRQDARMMMPSKRGSPCRGYHLS